MPYQYDRNLEHGYNPSLGYFHFVLYIEPPVGPGSGINAPQRFDAARSCYAREWLARLTKVEPDALHVCLVGTRDAPNLWHPCVYDDPDSPSAVSRDGCVCWQTFRDPVTWLPVAAHHYRTVSGNHENWTHLTYAPLSLSEGARLSRLIIDHEAEMVWVRTENGDLHILPEHRGAGYSSGYHGGGPNELARMIDKIVALDGNDIAAGTRGQPSRQVYDWVSSKDADRTRDLTLNQLKLLSRTGRVS